MQNDGVRSEPPGAVEPERQRLPTMSDVAQRAGVSRQLVSMVMRDLRGPSEASRERILSAANELGYRPNASARLLRQGRTRLIGVMFAMRNPFQVSFVSTLAERANAENFGLVLGPRGGTQQTDQVLSELLSQRVEAVVAFNPDPSAQTLADALDLLPVVWMGEHSEEPRADNVHVDDGAGLRLAVRHLKSLGHDRITYVGGLGGKVGRDRSRAYETAMKEEGLGSFTKVIASDFSEEGGATAARQMLPTSLRPTAVICCSDQNAAGVLAVLFRAGVRVPEDVSVVGFDDSYAAGLSYNGLTSLRQDVEATVEAAFSAVLERTSDAPSRPKVVLTPTTLVQRSSTGAAPTGAARKANGARV